MGRVSNIDQIITRRFFPLSMKKKITQNIGEEKTVFPRVRKGETVVLDVSFKKNRKK